MDERNCALGAGRLWVADTALGNAQSRPGRTGDGVADPTQLVAFS